MELWSGGVMAQDGPAMRARERTASSIQNAGLGCQRPRAGRRAVLPWPLRRRPFR